jgi:hypothetical protein
MSSKYWNWPQVWVQRARSRTIIHPRGSSRGSEILDFEAISKGGFEGDEERAVSVDEDANIDVDG